MLPHLLRKFLITAPFALLIGACIGLIVARDRGGGISVVALISLAAVIVTLVTQLLHMVVVGLLPITAESPESEAVGLVCDLVVGGITGSMLAPALNMPAMHAIGFGSGFLFLQGFVIEKLVIQNLIGNAIGGFLLPPGTHTPPEYSLAAAHAARGDFATARAELAEHARAAPTDPRPLLALARMERVDAHDYARAAAALERVLALPHIDFGTETTVTRELAELMLRRLDRRGHALFLLARYADRHRDRTDAKWAKTWLAESKAETL